MWRAYNRSKDTVSPRILDFKKVLQQGLFQRYGNTADILPQQEQAFFEQKYNRYRAT